MARLTDPDMLRRYLQVLKEWQVQGAIELEGRSVIGLRTTLEGVTVKYFKNALYQFVCSENGEIDRVKEKREQWRDHWEWHFDLRPTINGVKLYIETRLDPESETSRKEPCIRIVQIK